MIALSLTMLALPFVLAGAVLALAALRPGRGLRWTVLALAGAAITVMLPVTTIGLLEGVYRINSPGTMLMLILGVGGLGLCLESMRRKWLAAAAPPPGHCPFCGYNRAGITAGAACPECGESP